MGKRGPKPKVPKNPLEARHLYIRQLAEIIGYVDASGDDTEEYERFFKKIEGLVGVQYRKRFAARLNPGVQPEVLLWAVQTVLVLIRPGELSRIASETNMNKATVLDIAINRLHHLLPDFDLEYVSPGVARRYTRRSPGIRPSYWVETACALVGEYIGVSGRTVWNQAHQLGSINSAVLPFDSNLVSIPSTTTSTGNTENSADGGDPPEERDEFDGNIDPFVIAHMLVDAAGDISELVPSERERLHEDLRQMRNDRVRVFIKRLTKPPDDEEPGKPEPST